ncbi:tetratricopeptide repeat protein [Dokdonella soli]|uniref:Tetratricopeptide repeat protein n=1 Tax=Dokdonella soli TaxID=529810 RepID=A0ABP3TNI8_9GAMM
MLKEAIDLHRQGRLDEAEQGYRAQLVEHPDDADALHLLGMLRYQRGDAQEGARLLGRAHELAPQDANIELSLASLRFREGDHAAAKPHFERALALDPNLGGAHAGIGQIALMQGEHALAEQHFRIALRAGEEPHALAGLGALLLERGDIEGALRHLGRAADLAPQDAMIQMTLGQAFMKRDTPAFAEQAFLNALRLRPDLHQVRLWLGSLLLKAKRFHEAEAQFRELLPIRDFAVEAYIGLGDVARAEHRFDEAATGYRAALMAAPTHSMATRALAWTLAQQGRNDEAIEAYDAHLSKVPDDHAVRTARADLLMMIGRLPDAATDWKGLLDENPADLQARSRLALLSEHLGQLDTARAHADLVLNARPVDPDMQLVRVRAQMRDGENVAARASLEALASQALNDSQNRLCWNYLGRLHDRAGEAVEAVRCFSEAQRGLSAAMPRLDDPHPDLQAALAEPVAEPWAQAPILLLGTPGSGVEQVAALLADQPQLIVLRDRIGGLLRDDDFNRPRFPYYCGELGAADREALRERWLTPLRASGVALDRPVIDWLPRWDAHLLALVRRAMPGTRLVIVERDPRDALLNWLAFGWADGFPCAQPEVAAEWLARARRHLGHGGELGDPRRLVVAADALLDNAQLGGVELARFLGVDALQPGSQFAAAQRGFGGLPTRFAGGHWQGYRDALAEAFRHFD